MAELSILNSQFAYPRTLEPPVPLESLESLRLDNRQSSENRIKRIKPYHPYQSVSPVSHDTLIRLIRFADIKTYNSLFQRIYPATARAEYSAYKHPVRGIPL